LGVAFLAEGFFHAIELFLAFGRDDRFLPGQAVLDGVPGGNGFTLGAGRAGGVLGIFGVGSRFFR
jgi:hypothetical protein